MQDLQKKWQLSVKERSGNLTTNDYLSVNLRKKLLSDVTGSDKDIKYIQKSFPSLCKELDQIIGMKILSGLQKLHKSNNITVYRAIRFPTLSRIWETVHKLGLSMSNYEQERILQIYNNKEYINKRKNIQQDALFQTQPQERVIDGVPIFASVNDAIQIHRAYRHKTDRVLLIAIHIPYQLIKNNSLTLITNSSIDTNYDNDSRDCKINQFKKVDNHYCIDFRSLRVRGIELNEMYFKGLPFDLKGHSSIGIQQKFFLLDINKIDIKNINIENLSDKILKKYEYFLHGLYGDQNPFGRSPTKYLPTNCSEIITSLNTLYK